MHAPLPLLDATCRVRTDASLPPLLLGNNLLVPLTLDGMATQMKLDTGAEVSSLVPQIVRQLGLPREPGPGRRLRGIGGDVSSPSVLAHQVRLGAIPMHPQVFSVGGLDPAPGLAPPFGGILGQDLVSGRDIDLDLPDHRVDLVSVSQCPAFGPWAGAQGVALTRVSAGLFFTVAVVDGHAVRALLDTGASTTTITRRLAAALGISNAALAGDPIAHKVGISGREMVVPLHRVGQVTLGPVAWTDVTVAVTAADTPADMLLGADLLTRQRVWLSAYRGILWLR